jgi:hypothetical protein
VEQGKIATSAEDLRSQYQQHYGAWPYAGISSRDSYFLSDYPEMCKTIEGLSRQIVPERNSQTLINFLPHAQ